MEKGGKMANTNKGKLPVVLLIFLILVSLSLAGGVFFLLQKERVKNVALQAELEDLKTRQSVTEKKLAESQNFISSLEIKLEEARGQITTLTTELQQEKVTKEEALTKIEQLRTDLEQQKLLRSDLEKKFSQAQQDVEKIQAQLKDLESRKADLEAKVKNLEVRSQGVELGRIVVNPETGLPEGLPAGIKAPALDEGKVLVVNKDYDFLVIDLGNKDGTEVGNVFSVYHNNKYVGDVKVEKVHDSMSAAGFLDIDTKDKVSEGDKVVRRTK